MTRKRFLAIATAAVMLVLLVAALFAVNSRADKTLSNVALGKTVTTPDEERGGDSVTRLNDGNLYNFWETRVTEYFTLTGAEQNGYAVIDLGTGHYIDRVTVYVYHDAVVNYSYDVLASLDGLIWRTVGSKTLEQEAARSVEFDFDNCALATARYVKIVAGTNDSTLNQWGCPTNNGVHIAEVQVWGYEDESYVEPDTSDATVENLAFGKTVTATYVKDSDPPSNITDGKMRNFWEGRWGSEAVIDLGSGCYIDYIQVYLACFWNDDRDYTYDIYASLDGQDYDLIYSKDSFGLATTDGETVVFNSKTLKTARYIKIKMNANNLTNNNGTHLAEVEVYGYVDKSYEPPLTLPEGATITNVALNKPISTVSTAAENASNINDGKTGNMWEPKSLPATLELDLQKACYITSINVHTWYGGDNRYYHYKIWGSEDGNDYELLVDKSDDGISAAGGDTFNFPSIKYARYVKIEVLYNSVNEAGHIKELIINGCEDPNYDDIDADRYDMDNIAYKKKVLSNLSSDYASNVTDGKNGTTWDAPYYPATIDVDLEEQYDISEVILYFPVADGRYYYYTVYGSNDYKTFDRLARKRTKTVADKDGDSIPLSGAKYRYVRVYVEYCSGMGTATLAEVRVHGTACGTGSGDIRGGSFEQITGLKAWSETEYAAPIEESEIFENIYGIIDRTVGKEYRDWFSFEIKANTSDDKDYYELYDKDGKIHIVGNEGLSITSGINYYYKNYCNVNISEQADQVKMPSAIVPIGDGIIIRNDTSYETRYALNYCTLDYTFAFFDEDDYQKELDWLALNGVNCVLDLAGQEAVWIKFLMNFNYTYDEAKNWLSGPAYYAWQFMQNLEITGGPISDQWVIDRLEMARIQQRWKKSLGMDTVLQTYTGMVPTDFADHMPGVELIEQNQWAGLDRPYMLRTDSDVYADYAALFYAAQDWAFGDISDHYAGDPFHEGGKKPTDLGEDVIAKNVIEALIKYDSDAVWMVQAWTSNPTAGLLEGVKDYKEDHIMILDLGGMRWYKTAYTDNNNPIEIDNPGTTYLDDDEFNNTNWTYCFLWNYGGVTRMGGNLKEMTDFLNYGYEYTNLEGEKITKYLRNAEHLKGIGIISEATYDNPVKYDMVWDLVWDESKIDINEWLEDYTVRRYGAKSESAIEAWKLLYNNIYVYYGTSGYLMEMPENVKDPKEHSPHGNIQKAFKLLIEDFDLLSQSEGYMYDLSELMRQIVSNESGSVLKKLYACYNDGDLDGFRKYKAEYLALFDLANDVAESQQDMLVGEWIGKAEDWASRDGFDDFSYDQLTQNAKMLITTWAGYNARQIVDYAKRGYNGLYLVYKERWSNYLDEMEAYLTDGTALKSYTTDELRSKYFHYYWEWIMNTPEYTRKADNSPENMKSLATRVLLGVCPALEMDDRADFLTYDGYQVRMTDYNGLRSRFVVDLTKFDAIGEAGYTVLEYGTLVSASEKLTDGELPTLTKGSDGTYSAQSFVQKIGVYTAEGGYTAKYTEKTDTEIVYYVTVVNFDANTYTKEITLRGYAVVKDASGTEFVVYFDYPNEDYRSISLETLCTNMAAEGLIKAGECVSYDDVLKFKSQSAE